MLDANINNGTINREDAIFIYMVYHKWNMKTFNDFDGLALFIRIVQAGGLAAAERATGIPKATLSRRLSVLEESLNVRLARRTQKGIVLTEHGKQLFDKSHGAFALAEEAIAEVQDEQVALSGLVRISLPPDLASALLAPALIHFKEKHPEVVIDMMLSDRNISLVEEGYDLVVRMGPAVDSGLLYRKISTLDRVLVASPGFLAKYPSLQVPHDLENLPALGIRRDLVKWDLKHFGGGQVSVHPKVVFAANRQLILAEAACAGLGIVNLPEFLIQSALADGTLVPVLPDWQPSPVEMTALWQKDRITGRLIKAIVSEFEQTCHSLLLS